MPTRLTVIDVIVAFASMASEMKSGLSGGEIGPQQARGCLKPLARARSIHAATDIARLGTLLDEVEHGRACRGPYLLAQEEASWT